VQDIGIQSGAVVGGATVETINARRLHGFLGNSRAFANWIQERIEKYGFEENKDFVCLTEKLSNAARGGHNRKEYHVTLDMAKELAMVERTDKGREARKYFIECEKRVLRPNAISNLNGLVRPLTPRYDGTRLAGTSLPRQP
jgi:phage anti-repressor protein